MYPILGAMICKDSRVATLNVESTRWGLGRLQSNECSSSERTFESEFSDLFSISRSAPHWLSAHQRPITALSLEVWEHILSHISFQFLLIRVFSHIVHFRKILKVFGCIGSQTRNESIAWNKHALPRIYHLLTLPILCCWPRKLSLRRSLMTTGKWIFGLFFWKPQNY